MRRMLVFWSTVMSGSCGAHGDPVGGEDGVVFYGRFDEDRLKGNLEADADASLEVTFYECEGVQCADFLFDGILSNDLVFLVGPEEGAVDRIRIHYPEVTATFPIEGHRIRAKGEFDSMDSLWLDVAVAVPIVGFLGAGDVWLDRVDGSADRESVDTDAENGDSDE